MKHKYILALLCLIIGNHCLALKPEKDYIKTPDSLGMGYKELQITTPDNYALTAWTMQPDKKKDNKTVIVLAYGDAMNMSYWIEQCYYFVEAGFTVVTFDYRGFGHSSPFSMDSNQLYYDEFATDLQSVVSYARSDFKGYKVGVRALSMGTAIATVACSKEPFDFLIGDSYVCDPVAMQDGLKKMTGRTFAVPAGATQYKTQLNDIKTPMLVFSGTKDKNTPLSDCKKMVAGHPNRKLVSYEGGHLEGIYILSGKSFGAAYVKDVTAFVKSVKVSNK